LQNGYHHDLVILLFDIAWSYITLAARGRGRSLMGCAAGIQEEGYRQQKADQSHRNVLPNITIYIVGLLKFVKLASYE